MKIRKIGSNQTELTTGGGAEVFFSYETPVVVMVPGDGLLVTEKKFSRTTSRHIKSYLDGRDAKLISQDAFNHTLYVWS